MLIELYWKLIYFGFFNGIHSNSYQICIVCTCERFWDLIKKFVCDLCREIKKRRMHYIEVKTETF